MKKTILILLLAILATSISTAQEKESHTLFTEILKDYIKNGLVDYAAMKGDTRLDEYIEQITVVDPYSLERNEQLAFWMNAYNAFTLQVILLEYPVESINDLHTGGLIIGQVLGKTIWHDERFEINGKKYSLNNIEHDIIRVDFADEPRIHFTLVCAAMSCPPLRYEAYEAHKLEEQFQDQSIKFFNNPNLNEFDAENRVAKLSKLLDWYYDDFADNDKDIILYVAQFVEGEAGKSMKANPEEWDIEHLHYDWLLNEIKSE